MSKPDDAALALCQEHGHKWELATLEPLVVKQTDMVMATWESKRAYAIYHCMRCLERRYVLVAELSHDGKAMYHDGRTQSSLVMFGGADEL